MAGYEKKKLRISQWINAEDINGDTSDILHIMIKKDLLSHPKRYPFISKKDIKISRIKLSNQRV
jgi:hypothetical protein